MKFLTRLGVDRSGARVQSAECLAVRVLTGRSGARTHRAASDLGIAMHEARSL
jgi:hypothetical protein